MLDQCFAHGFLVFLMPNNKHQIQIYIAVTLPAVAARSGGCISQFSDFGVRAGALPGPAVAIVVQEQPTRQPSPVWKTYQQQRSCCMLSVKYHKECRKKNFSSLLILIAFIIIILSGASSLKYHFVSSFPPTAHSTTKKENKATFPLRLLILQQRKNGPMSYVCSV